MLCDNNKRKKKIRVVKSIRLTIGFIPGGSESLTDTFSMGFIVFYAGRVRWICVCLYIVINQAFLQVYYCWYWGLHVVFPCSYEKTGTAGGDQGLHAGYNNPMKMRSCMCLLCFGE